MPVLRVLSGIKRGDQVPSHARLEELDIHADVDALCSRALPALRWIRLDSYPSLPRMMTFLRSPLGLQLRKLSVTVSDGEAWNAWFSTRRFEWGVVAQLDTPWRLYFEGDKILCGYFNLGPPLAEPEILAGLTRTLASVVERATYHLRIGKKLHSTEGLESLLKSFASHALAE